MRTLRSWKREARLLLIVEALSKAGEPSSSDAFMVDFLLQHPSLLSAFARHGTQKLPPAAEPHQTETESSEEALLSWKRSVGDQVLAPMLGRLVSRGLVGRSGDGRIAILPLGSQMANGLQKRLGTLEKARLEFVTQQVETDQHGAREWLREALAEVAE